MPRPCLIVQSRLVQALLSFLRDRLRRPSSIARPMPATVIVEGSGIALSAMSYHLNNYLVGIVKVCNSHACPDRVKK